MRKQSEKQRQFILRKQRSIAKIETRNAHIRKARKKKLKLFIRKHEAYFSIKQQREQFRRKLYKGNYNGLPINLPIVGDLGIEDASRRDHFLETASSIIDFKSRDLTFDLSKCTRLWPSSITLLCSLIQWVELSTSLKSRPRLASTPSKSDRLNSYLSHCGFYSYVKRLKDTDQNYYSDSEIVKIQREERAKDSDIEAREDEIVELLKRYSLFSSKDISLFNCKILTEAFNNVIEHGVSHRDKGWWLLCQYHKTHGIISLCIADNGIGIRNSLMTGPQAGDIERKIANKPENDGEFIKMALLETVSGALEAPLKTAGYISKRYEKGQHRGNGLKRITETCRNLSIPFSVLSHFGYVFIEQDGQISNFGSKAKRIFAGTLYHLIIPAKRS